MYDVMLVVDDLEMNRASLRALFEDSFKVLEAKCGREALGILEQHEEKINIILLDLIMPDVSGMDFLGIRKETEYLKDIPVVVITASDAVNDQLLAFKYGANDYITKPFIPEIITTRVNNVISSNMRMSAILKERQELQLKSELDQMTNLYNKTTAEQLIDEILRNGSGKLHAMIAIDIDDFKAINDTEGHLIGDHTIKILADLIAAQFRKSDIVGRIGGDEFIVLMNDIPAKELAREKAREMVRLLKYKPNLTLPANVSVSIGITFNEGESRGYMDLFGQVDQSLYQSKKLGKARFTEYGVQYLKTTQDERNTVILCSRDKTICDDISNVVSDGLDLIDVGSVEEMVQTIFEQGKKVLLIYVDVSEEKDSGALIWNKINGIEAFDEISKFAICKEGHMEQFKQAILAGVCDVVTSPVYIEILKRRTIKCIEEQLNAK